MDRFFRALSGVVAATLLASAGAAENLRPRGAAAPPPLTPEEKAAMRLQKAEDIDAWLPRLVGRFRVEGVVNIAGAGEQNPLRATGKVDCIAVGDGPGVQCVVYVFWHEVLMGLEEMMNAEKKSPVLTAGAPFMGPASVLYGTDPNAVAIRFMELDTDGLVTDGAARFDGNTMYRRFEGYCPSEPQEICLTETRLYAPPHGRYLHLTIDIWPLGENSEGEAGTIDLEMTRIPQDGDAATPRVPAPDNAPAPGPGAR